MVGWFTRPRHRDCTDWAGHAGPVGTAGVVAPRPVLVAYATQTGAAEQLAHDTWRDLHDAGVTARLLDFETLSVQALHGVDRALFLVSTTYDGDPPDMAETFSRDSMGQAAHLTHLHYGLLALGDSIYGNFCAFGRRLHLWLQASGAQPLFDAIEMDDGNESALTRWRECLAAAMCGAGGATSGHAPDGRAVCGAPRFR